MALKHLASINNKQGFTIVELLIVIVVIGILAAITIVSYTGIAASAYAAKASSSAGAYVKLLEMYRVEHGAYPEVSEGVNGMPGMVCLGNASDYPAEGIFGDSQCAVGDDGSGGVMVMASVDEDFNDLLTEHANQLPSGNLPQMHLGGPSYRGLFYGYVAAEGESLGIGYALSGDQDCPKGERFYIEEMNFSGCTIYLGTEAEPSPPLL